jgi:hypothetical protein
MSGRYNDPQGRFRVLYAASERRAAFMETLSAFRPALRDLALVESLLPPGEFDLPRSIGHVPAAYFTKRMAAFRLDHTQRWLDLRSPQTHAIVRVELASELVTAGYSGAFNFGEIIGSDYMITQLVSRRSYDSGYSGIAYPSTHDASLTCWAIFDRASVTLVGTVEPIRQDDPDLVAAIDLFGLMLLVPGT